MTTIRELLPLLNINENDQPCIGDVPIQDYTHFSWEDGYIVPAMDDELDTNIELTDKDLQEIEKKVLAHNSQFQEYTTEIKTKTEYIPTPGCDGFISSQVEYEVYLDKYGKEFHPAQMFATTYEQEKADYIETLAWQKKMEKVKAEWLLLNWEQAIAAFNG